MGLQHFYARGSHLLSSVDSRVAYRKRTISGTFSCPNYCEIFTVYTQFTKVGAGSIIQPGGPRVGDLCITYSVCVCVCVCVHALDIRNGK